MNNTTARRTTTIKGFIFTRVDAETDTGDLVDISTATEGWVSVEAFDAAMAKIGLDGLSMRRHAGRELGL